MSGTCPRARCDNDKGLLHQSLTVGLPHFSFVPPIFSMPDSLLAIPDLTICRSADPQIPRSPDLQILILSTTSRSAMPGCDKIFWFALPARRSDRCGKKRYLLWNWFFITLSHLQKRIAHSSRFDWRSVFKNKKTKKKNPHSRPAAAGNFTLHLAWRLIGSCSIFRRTRFSIFISCKIRWNNAVDMVWGRKRNDLDQVITIWHSLFLSLSNCHWSIIAFALIDFCFDSLMNLVIYINVYKCREWAENLEYCRLMAIRWTWSAITVDTRCWP